MKVSQASKAAFFALISAAGMIANHIAGKATRDAVFLSIYEVEALANMLIVASGASILAVILVTRMIAKFGPQYVVPIAFFTSSGFFLLERLLLESLPKIGAVSLYLHIAAVGAVLISGFWSVINEKFDPHTAKRYVGRIAGGATIGGLLGGVLAERVAATGEMKLMIPILAGLHFLSGVMLLLASKGGHSAKMDRSKEPKSSLSDYFSVLKSPYLRSIAVLVLLLTSSGAIIDYLMKGQAVATYGKGDELLRFFAMFYTGAGLAALVVQFLLTRWFLQKFGNATATSTVPTMLTIGGVALAFFPNIIVAVIAKAGEMFLRNSIYRSGYELLYTPVPKSEKRNGKMLIDVGVDRMADAVGGGLISVVLFIFAKSMTSTALALVAAALGLGAFIASRKIFKGYVRQLETNLKSQDDLNPEELKDNAKEMMQTFGAMQFDLTQLLDGEEVRKVVNVSRPSLQKQDEVKDPVLRDLQILSGHDSEEIIKLLKHKGEELKPSAYPQLISLLAWDAVYKDVIPFLREHLNKIEGQLLDHLLDEDEDFVIRRRIPRVLKVSSSKRVVEGLLSATKDRRFEVRYQASAALQSILKREKDTEIDEEKIYTVILKEIELGKDVWSRQQVLDEMDEAQSELDEFIQVRAGRSVDYIFRLLSLVHSDQALLVAYYGLYTDDTMLRGTSLEYLDSILPAKVKEALWPYFDEKYIQKNIEKSKKELQNQVMDTQQSIQINLQALKNSKKD